MSPLTPPVALALEGGGAAELRAADGDQALVASSRAFPPGSTLAAAEPGGLGGWRLKVKACRQREPGAALPFHVEGRWVNLSRAQRERVAGGA